MYHFDGCLWQSGVSSVSLTFLCVWSSPGSSGVKRDHTSCLSVCLSHQEVLSSLQMSLGALEFRIVFKSLFYWLKSTVLSKTVKIDLFGLKTPFLTLRFLRVFQISQLKLRNSSFKQNGLFLHQTTLRNSILIKVKYRLSILEILDFTLFRYPKKTGTRTSARLSF